MSHLAAGAAIETVAEGFQFTEGPCILPDESLVFSDIPADRMYRHQNGQVTVYREPSYHANGNSLDGKGRLLTCEHGARRVRRQEADGTMTVLAERFQGKRLNSPNDLAVHPNGAVFFTDPPYGIRPEEAELGYNGVYAIWEGEIRLLDDTFERPNGLVFDPRQSALLVADTARSHIRRFELSNDGELRGGEVWGETMHPDGLRLDEKGRVWSASRDGVDVLSPEGMLLETIAFPQQPANLCFDAALQTLYVTARTGVYRVAVSP